MFRAVLPLGFLCTQLLTPLAMSASAEEAVVDDVSRTAPPIYEERLAQYLSDPTEALEKAGKLDAEEDSAAIVLWEDVVFVDESGKIYELRHRIYQALTEAGRDSIARDVQGFRKDQKLHLIAAETIQPDGRRLELDPNATILQAPQRDADLSIYSEVEELVLIFPQIRQGSAARTLVLVESEEFRIPGEFTDVQIWQSTWPIVNRRAIYHLPAALEKRLRAEQKGEGIPQKTRKELEDNRVLLTWQKADIPGARWEPRRGPRRQTGPMLWLTTLADWQAFAEWYAPLLRERSTLSPELREKVANWTADAETQEEIIEILFQKTARDVRYTSIDFGRGGLQPQSASSVWQNRYGDCKDKSNFLRCLLAEKGITAHFALVNTRHLGLILRDAPDYRHFNHAILAVEKADGSLLFCDPTIEYARPGVISPSSGNRDVLLIQTGDENGLADDPQVSARWVRSDSVGAGKLLYTFDWQVAPTGELTGWFTFKATGYYGASEMNWFTVGDENLAKDRVIELVDYFEETADLIDYEYTQLEDWDGEFELRAYLVSATQTSENTSMSLGLSKAAKLVPDPGDVTEVANPLHFWPEYNRVTKNFALPAGYSARDIPPPYQVESEALNALAEWSTEDNTLTGKMEFWVTRHRVDPPDYGAMRSAVRSFNQWLERPVLIRDGEHSGEGQDATADRLKHDELSDFPIMPSGQGQLRLLNKRYPANGNRKLRREALAQTKLYFPDDPETFFDCEIYLASMDWDDAEEEEALKRLRKAISNYRGKVGAESVGWAQYMEALCLRDLERDDEALEVLEDLANNANLSAYRRGWGSLQAAWILQDSNPAEALEHVLALRENEGVRYEETLWFLLARSAALENSLEELPARIHQLVAQAPENLEALLLETTYAIEDLLQSSEQDRIDAGKNLLQALQTTEIDHPAAEGEFSAKLDALETDQSRVRQYRDVRENLVKYLEENTFDYLEEPELPEDLETYQDYQQAMDAAQEAGEREQALKIALAALVELPVNAQFPDLLWRAGAFAEWRDKNNVSDDPDPLQLQLIDLMKQLPPDEVVYNDGWFLLARYYQRRGEFQKEKEALDKLLSFNLDRSWHASLYVQLGRNAEELGQWEEALKYYAKLQPLIGEYDDIYEGLLRKIFIHLEREEPQAALETIERVEEHEQGDLAESYHAQLHYFLIDLKNAGNAQEAWETYKAWWPRWQELAAKLGYEKDEALEGRMVVEPFASWDGQMEEITVAVTTKDRQQLEKLLKQTIRNARWVPQVAVGMGYLFYQVSEVYPEHSQAILRFSADLLENAKTPDLRQLYGGLVVRAAIYSDTGQYEKLWALVEQNAPQVKDADAILQYTALLRLHVYGGRLSGNQEELQKAISALEELYATGTVAERPLTSRSLAQAYETLGQHDKAVALLEKELEHPEVAGDAQVLQGYQSYLENLQERGHSASEFDAAVQDWIAKFGPGWLDFVEPKDESDPRLQNRQEVANRLLGEGFTPQQKLKIYLIFAQSEESTLEQKTNLFGSALPVFSSVEHDPLVIWKAYQAVLDDERFPSSLHKLLLLRSAEIIEMLGEPQYFENLKNHPSLKFSDAGSWNSKDGLEDLELIMTVDYNDPDAVGALAQKFAQREGATHREAHGIFTLAARLLEHGHISEAEEFGEILSSMNMTPGGQDSRTALRLELARHTRQAQNLIPLYQLLSETILEHFSEDLVENPELPPGAFYPRRLKYLSIEDAYQVVLHRIRDNFFPRHDLDYWRIAMDTLKFRHQNDLGFVFPLLEKALEIAPDDPSRVELTRILAASTDIDDPDNRDKVRQILKPFRNPANPLTAEEVRRRFIRMDIRTGKLDDFAGALKQEKDALMRDLLLKFWLDDALLKENDAALRQALDSAEPEQLTTSFVLAPAYLAATRLGRDVEAELLFETALNMHADMVADAWAFPRSYEIHQLRELEYALGEKSPGIPDAMFADFLERTGNDYSLAVARIFRNDIREDWPKLEAAATEAIEAFPTWYFFYYSLGKARYQQDRKTEALEPLQVYTKHVHDDLRRRQALDWIAEIQAD